MKRSYFLLLCLSFTFSWFAQTLNYYYGNLHSHSGYSDGNKDSLTTNISKPAGDYNFAKASLHFNFLGISEHNHYSANNNPGMIRTSYALGLAEAAAANQDGTFLCLYGMEFGVASNGHVIIYGVNQLLGWENSVPGLTGPNYDVYIDKTDYTALFRKVNNTPGAFCYLAHPWWTDFGNIGNLPHIAAYDSAIVGTPFRSGLAFSTFTNYLDYPSGDYIQYYKKMLGIGYHIGMTYDHDNHNLTFGRNNAGRLVILAPSLTQSNFYSAMKNMHFYGSDDWNAKLDFKIGTKIMGDSTSGLTPPVINFIHNDDDGEIADSILLWSGVEGSNQYPVLTNVVQGNNTLNYTDNTQSPGTNKFYFIEVIQPDGDRIISSPIWYRLSNFAGITETTNGVEVVAFPNPVNSILYFNTGLNSEYTMQLSDVQGRVVKVERFFTPAGKISTNDLLPGIYFMEVKSKGKSSIRKIVIE